jgi:hypothetical protein
MSKDQTPTVRGANSLDAITSELRALRTKDAESMLRAGELLIAAKTAHATAGTSFGRWVNTEFAWSERTAQDWMLATKWYNNLDDKIRSNCGGLSRTALIRLAQHDQQDPKENAPFIECALSLAGKRPVGASEVEDILFTGRTVEDYDAAGKLIEREDTDADQVDEGKIQTFGGDYDTYENGKFYRHAVLIKTPAEIEASEREAREKFDEDNLDWDSPPETPLSRAVRSICEAGSDAPLSDLAALDSADVGRAAFILNELALRMDKQAERERFKEIADRAEARSAGAITTTYCTIDHDEPGNVPRELCTVCRRLEKAQAS